MNTSTTWEDVDFRKAVYEMITTDDRFSELTGYLSGVHICWSYKTRSASSGYGFLFFNPDWWDLHDDEQRKTHLYFHTLALLSRHAKRSKGMNPIYANMASECVLSSIVRSDGFSDEEDYFYFDEAFEGYSLERAYVELHGDESHVPSEHHMGAITAEMLEEMIQDVLEHEALGIDDHIAWDEQQIIRTIEEHPSIGIGLSAGTAGFDLNIGMGMETVQEATYEEILAPYMKVGDSTTIRTYRRPSRRSSNSSELILPGRLKQKGKDPDRMEHLYLLLDVSGSIGEAQARQFNYSAQTIKKIIDPELMTVMFFDTRIVMEKTFSYREKYTELKVRAGGGTDLKRPYQRIKMIQPELVMIFTDLQVVIPPEPEWDTIWMVPAKNTHVPSNIYGPVYKIPPKQ